MARYTPGVAGTLQGSVGNWTFSRNRWGPYVRTRAIPVSPNTTPQQLVKAFFGALSIAWSATLTTAQRAAWNLYAANTPRPQSGGGVVYLTGHEHFIRSNVPRGQHFASFVLDAPIVFDVGTYTTPLCGITSPASQISVTFDPLDAWANEDGAHLLVWGARPKGVGVNYFKGPWSVAGKIDGASVLPPTSPALIAYPYLVSGGQRAWFRASVSRADGRLSDDVKLEATVI